MVVVGTGGSKTRYIKTKWPFTIGLTAGTTKRSTSPYLKPIDCSNIVVNDKVGIDG